MTEVNQFMGRANAMFRVVPEWKGFFDVQEEDADGNVITGDERRDVMVCTYKYTWDKELYNHKKVINKNGKDWYPGKWRLNGCL